MPYDPKKHNRQSLCLPQWDYRRPGAYFVTVCTHNRMHLFGEVVDGNMVLNPHGRIVVEEWRHTEQVRDNVMLDAFVVMPNHVHGIICITANPGNDCPDPGGHPSPRSSNPSTDDTGANPRRDSLTMNPCDPSMHPYPALNPHGRPRRSFGGAVAGSLSTIMRQSKSMVTKRINRRRGMPGAPVWQRNFYERIVRNRRALNRIRTYIHQNPAQWHRDRNHPRR